MTERERSPGGARSHPKRVYVARLLTAIAVGLGLLVGLQFVGVIRFPIIDTSIAIRTHFDGKTLVVDGSTTLVDGAIIGCDAWHLTASGEADFLYSDGAAPVVAGGGFQCRANLAGWPAGGVRAYVQFKPYRSDQPDVVRYRYGSRGEHLGGLHVTSDSDGWTLIVTDDIVYAGG
jgi:hypothetical protein